MYSNLKNINYSILTRFFTVVLFFCVINVFGGLKYWVGGNGLWNASDNWTEDINLFSKTNLPTLQDTVVITDVNAENDLYIDLTGKTFAKTILIKSNRKIYLSSAKNSHLYLTNSFKFPSNVVNDIQGKVTLLNKHSTNQIQFFAENEFAGLIEAGEFKSKNQIKPLSLDITIDVTDVSCHSAKDGAIELTINNGTGPFTYDWLPNLPPLNGDGTNRVTDLDPGLYNVIVTDLFDNTQEILVDINVSSPSPITVVRLGSSLNVTCPGGNDGRLNTTVFGGQGPYTFSWNTSPVQTSQNALNLRAGNYQLTVTDATNCVANSQIFTVTQPPTIQANFSNVITVDCNGNCNGEATADVTGGTPGYTYLWYDAANENIPTAQNLCAGTYNIRVTDSRGCVDTVQLIMTEPDVLTLPYDSTNVTCFELDNGTITISPVGGTAPYSYNWLNTPNIESLAFVDSLPPGTYNVTVTDFRGCIENAEVNIEEPLALNISISSSTNVLCFEQCTGEATASVLGGTTPYQLNWLNVTGNPTTNSVNQLCADTFYVAVTDVNNCLDTASVIITQPLDSISITLTDTVYNQCFGECAGEATVLASGGTGLLSYYWLNVPGNPTISNVTNLCGDIYQVRVTDANGCRDTLDVEIPSLGLLTGNVVKTDVSCGGLCDGAATVVQTGGVRPYNYDWYDLPGGSTDSSITDLCAGVYNVKITDANGCLDTVEVTIIAPPTLSLNLNTLNNVDCKGECNGAVTVTRTGGTAPFIFSWFDTPGNPTTLSYNQFCAGTYNLAVEDGINCKDTIQVTITEPALELSSSIIDSLDLRCFGVCAGEATVEAVGGTFPYTFRWYNAGNQTSSSVNNLCAGTSYVEITDFNGCKDTSSVILTQPASHIRAEMVDSVNLTCFGVCIGSATVTYSGGIPPYTVDWYNFGNASTDQISNICAGTYFVQVLDSNLCSDTVSVNISQPSQIGVFNTSRLPTCRNDCDGILSVVPFGGTGAKTLQWLNIPGNPTTSSIPNLCAGNYQLSLTDEAMCNRVVNVPLNNPSSLGISISNVIDVACKGDCSGSATVRGVGGLTPYSFSWINTPDQGNDSTENNLCFGTYTVSVTDSNGCSTSRLVSVNEPVDFLSGQQIAMDSTLCFYSFDGQAEVQGLGGTAPYSFDWFTANNQTGEIVDSLGIGTYLVKITDFNGCLDTISVNVSGPDALKINPNIRHISCNSTNDGNIKLNPSGGYPPYNFNWLELGNLNQDSVFNLTAGFYNVVLTDANNCVDTFEIEIIQTTQVFGAIDNASNLSCFNSCDGSITVSGTGGLGTYFYDWYDAPGNPTTPSVNNLCAGTFHIRVYDIAQCDDTLTISLTQPQEIVYLTSSTLATCNGICDATAELNFVSGDGPLSLVWLNVPGNPTTNLVTNVCVYTLSIQLRDGNNCLDTAEIIISAPDVVQASIADSVDNLCIRDCNGLARVEAVGGTMPYTYLWNTINADSLNDQISNLCNGVYTAKVTDFNGCIDEVSVTINSPDTLQTDFTMYPVSCLGGNDGKIKLNPTGGQTPYTFDWYDLGNLNTDSVFGLSIGTYGVVVTDFNGCKDSLSISVTQIPSLQAQVINNIPNVCFGENAAEVELGAVGGTGPYVFTWFTMPAAPTGVLQTNLFSGNYQVALQDALGCTDTINFAISPPDSIQYQVDLNGVSCFGQCDAEITVNVSGGIAPYNYNWYQLPGNPTTNTLQNLCVGTYRLQVTDDNGCVDTLEYNLIGPAVLQANITDSVDNLCISDCNGMSKATPKGGTAPYTYLWNTLAADSINDEINNLCNGVYTVKVTDTNGCIDSSGVTIGSPDTLKTTFTMYPVSCNGLSNGRIKLTPLGGVAPYSFDWYTLGNLTTDSVSGLSVGIYDVVVTDFNGCTDSLSIEVTQIPTLQAQVLNITPNICYGASNAQAEVGGIGGTLPYQYSWFTLLGSPTGAIQTNLLSGNYSVALQDALGCTDTINFAVSQPDSLSYQVNLKGISCFGNCDADIEVIVNGGISPYSYNWYQVPGSPTTNLLQNLCVGTYRLEVTDNNSCKDTLVYNLSSPAELVVNANGTDLKCNNDESGIIWVEISGGILPYSVLWNDNNLSTTDTVYNLSAQKYIVSVTDSNNCIHSDSIEIFEPSALQALISDTTMALCSCNGSATVTPTGGTEPYTYLWNDILAQSTSIANNLCASSYGVTVTDANSCSTLVNITITDTSNFAVNLVDQTNLDCFGSCNGSLTVETVSSIEPIIYKWNDPLNSTTPTVNNLCEGTYFVQATDGNNCVRIESFTITQPELLNIQFDVSNVKCNGANDGRIIANVSGGVAPYTFLWSNGFVNDTISELIAGKYTLTITDFNNCSIVDSVLITQPSVLTNNFNQRDVDCFGNATGFVQSIPTGGTAPYEFAWNLEAYSFTDSLSGIIAGKYLLTIKDSLGCTLEDSISINQNTAVTINFISDTLQVSCSCDAVATPIVSGGVYPYSFQWNDNNTQTDSVAINLCAGNYALTVTDDLNCLATAPLIVQDLNSFRVDISSLQNETCVDLCNGSITLSPVNGNAPYTFAFNDPLNSSSATVDNLCPGDYQALVQDFTNCSQVVNFTISEAIPLQTNLVKKDISCNGLCDGNLKAEVLGGNGVYSYLWNDDFASNTDSIFNLCARSFELVVTDGNNCKDTASISIVEPSELIVEINSITNVLCYGDSSGAVNISVNGGNLPYNYSWNSGEISQNLNNKFAGDYFVTVTDSRNCTDTISAIVYQNLKLEAILADSVLVDCAGQNSGSITISVSGGAYPYSYSWLGNLISSNDSIQNNLSSGVYTAIVQDANNCSDTVVVNLVTSPTALSINNVTKQNTNCVTCEGSISVDVSGGVEPYTYSWTNTSSINNSTVQNLCKGEYTFSVVDNIGCRVDSVITINVLDSLVIDARVVNNNFNVCFGEIATFAVVDYNRTSPPYSVQWNDPLLQTTDTAFNLTVGNYTVIVSNNGGCRDTVELIVNQGREIIIDSISTFLTSCSGICDGGAVYTASGGFGNLSVLWSNGNTIFNPTNLCEDLNIITVTDSLFCSVTDSVWINVNNPILTNAEVDNVLCFGDCNGLVEVNVLGGGVAPYRHSWNIGQTSNTLNNLCIGNYIDTVYDFNNCFIIQNIQVSEPEQLNLSVLKLDSISCNGTCDGKIVTAVSGGIGKYEFKWNNVVGLDSILNLCANSYSLIVTDSNNCEVQQNFELLEPSSINLAINSTNSSCNNTSDGFAIATMSGGFGNLSVRWFNLTGFEQFTNSINNLDTGKYFIEVQDQKSCSKLDSVIISAVNFVAISVVKDTSVCFGDTLNLTVTGGDTYLWSNGLTSSSIQVIPNQNTNLNVTAFSNLCSDLATVNINVNSLPTFTIDASNTVLLEGKTADLNVSPSEINWTYDWTPPLGLSDPTIPDPTANPSQTQVYYLKVTDENNCSSLDSIKITVTESIIFPDAITPNNDGLNDFWRIDLIEEFPQAVVEVYNRWGQLVFRSVGYSEKFNGTHNGKDLPVGTYYYVIDLGADMPKYTGPITIMR